MKEDSYFKFIKKHFEEDVTKVVNYLIHKEAEFLKEIKK